jgi:hypothetical protein
VAHAEVNPPTAACKTFFAASNAFGQLGELDGVEM